MSRGGKKKASYKGLVRKIGVIAFVAVNVLSITLTPTSPALAASFTFTQDTWAASADSSATAGHTGGAAQTGVTSFSTSSSSYLTTGAPLTVATSTGSFAQTNWSTINETSTANHTSNQTGWTSASTTDAQIDIGTAGSLKLSVVAGSVTQTNDGSTNTGFNLAGATNASTAITGTGDAANVGLLLASTATKSISTNQGGWAVAGGNACALKTDGTVFCWGYNTSGQLGDGTGTQRNTPVQVLKGTSSSADAYLRDVVQVNAGYAHTCAVKTDGTVYCWGNNSSYQLGDGTTTYRSTPVLVSGLTGVATVAAGNQHTCAVKTDGTAYCWGSNNRGQLGDDTTTTRTAPVQVSGLTGVASIFAGGAQSSSSSFSSYTCAVKTDGTAYCWGNNSSYQLGDGTVTQRNTPVQVLKGTSSSADAYLQGVAQVNAGLGHACAVKTDGTAYCWGGNSSGQLGDNTTTTRTAPVQVSGLTGVATIAADRSHSCATKTDGTAYCWGLNSNGEIGDGTYTQRNAPVQVSGLTAAMQIDVGRFNSCALKTDGTVYCWGSDDYGQLGSNKTAPLYTTVCSDGEGGYVSCYLALTPLQVMGVGASGTLNLNVYNTPGTYTSAIINLGTTVDFTTISWTETLNSQTLTMKVRSCDDSACSGETAFASITQTVCTTGCDVGQGGTLNTLTSVVDGHQYVQYQVTFSTTNTAVTPTLDSLTINEQAYPVEGTGYVLVSSPFNTEDSGKGISSISWTGATTSAATLRFQARTASSLAGLSSASWCGPTNCSGSVFDDTTNGTAITGNSALTDGANDQWFQYKAILTTSNGGTTPQLNDVTVTYVRVLDSTNGYTLISSPYDSGSTANVIGDVRMNVTALPSGTAAKIQVRTAASQGGLSAATWCGTDCTGSTYFTASGTGANTFTAIPSTLTDRADDQWFQYRITLIPSSNNLSAPIVTSASVTYVVNTAPTVTNVVATTAATTQGATDANAGKVTVTYDLTDDVAETSDTYESYLFYDVGVTLSSDNTTTLTVSDTSKMPSAPGYVQIGTEVIKYASIVNGTTLGTLTRGSSDLSWPGTSIRHTKAYTSGSVVWVKATTVTGDVGSVTKGTSKSMVWTPRSESQLASYSKYDAKVRVLVHDGNLANQLSSQSGSSTDSTNNVIIDNLAPTFSFTFDAGVAGETSSASVAMTTSSDATSTAQYMVADDAATHSSPTSTTWTTFATPGTRAWTFDSDFEQKIVKVQVRDPYGNAAATSTASTIMPAASSAFIVQDVSKLATSDWRLFIGWETATSSSFASYKIEYATSTDNIIYSSYTNATTPITVISTNYYVHQNLNTNWYYRYRLGVTDTNGNTTIRSNASTTAKPDGMVSLGEDGGGNDATPPAVTNVASSLVKATSATVSFNATDGASSTTNAAVYFATQTDFNTNVSNGKVDRERYTSKVGNPGYVTATINTAAAHTVALANLTKNIQYRYAVESCDATGNCQFEDASDAGYTFTTQNGPAIVSGSIVATPAFDSASITWKTDKASDSIVFYATTSASALADPISVGSNAQITSADGNGQYVHTVTIPNLTYSATYYYKVRSTDQNASSDSYTQYDESTIRSLTTTTQTPPTITAAAACTTTSSTATITWTTDQFSTTELSLLSADVGANYFSVVAGAQVAQYPTGTINSASRAAVGYVTAHSNTFTGLTESTTYYAKVRSLNASGGEVSSTLSCATPAKDVVGRTIVEVGDVTAPLIASLVIKDIKATSATIAWTTDESADSLVKYGVTMKYGGLGGSEEMTTDHAVTVSGLNPKTAYNFKVMSADQRGNRAYSGDQTFTTLSVQEEALLAKEDLESLKKELEELRGKAKTQESLQGAVQRFKAILKSVSTDVSLQDLEELTTEITDTITEITQEVVPPAIIGGVPQVDIEANKATITWRTNKPAGSIIALVSQDEYDSSVKDPYVVQVGQPREEVTTHVVTVPNLEPATAYHFQIRSQAKVGPEGKSRDFVFETKAELPQILDYSFKRITENSITVVWKTNTLSNSQVRYTPFADGDLVSADARTQGKPEFVKDHEVTVANLPSNTNFLIEISSADVTTASASKVIGTIRTTVDEKTPTISKVRSESTIFPGKTERTQTLIYWETDEPSTSQIFWHEGVGKGDLTEFSKLDQEYTTSHVMVLTSFKPGAVYRFQVESADPSNNKGRSTDFTILTPKKGETVIDLIITNFQDIFGFLKQL